MNSIFFKEGKEGIHGPLLRNSSGKRRVIGKLANKARRSLWVLSVDVLHGP
jgi:hypothetical protein